MQYERKRVLLAKLETGAYGSDASPAASDAILMNGDPKWTLEGDIVNREFVRAFFGATESIRATSYCTVEFECDLVSGAASTPLRPLLQACLHSATAVGAIGTGNTAQAGASSSITLANTSSDEDDTYNGRSIYILSGTGAGQKRTISDYVGSTRVATVSSAWSTTPDNTSQYVFTVAQEGTSNSITLAAHEPYTTNSLVGRIIEITAGTGIGQQRVISRYSGSTKVATVSRSWSTAPDNTSIYKVWAGLVVEPVTDVVDDYSVSLHWYQDGVRHIVVGAQGTVTFDLSAKGIPVARFKFWGLKGSISAQARPTPTYADWVKPIPVNKANTTDIMWRDYAGLVLAKLGLDSGCVPTYRNLPGLEEIRVTDRKAKASMTLQSNSSIGPSFWGDIEVNTTYSLGLRHGQTAGQTFTITALYANLVGGRYEGMDGITMFSGDLDLMPSSAGNDEYRLVFQ